MISLPTPHNHPCPGPHRSMVATSLWRIERRYRGPGICVGIISCAGPQFGICSPQGRETTPYDHFCSRPNCRMAHSRCWLIDRRNRCPSICVWEISGTIVKRHKVKCAAETAPNNHFTTCPDCCVLITRGWSSSQCCRRPGITGWVKLGTVILCHRIPILTSPDDHPDPGPDCRVVAPGFRCSRS